MCNKTLHTNTRAQQRGVPPVIIDLLLKFGAREHDGRGAEICYFNSKSKKKVQSYMGGLLGKLSEELNAYAVVNGDTVITVGTRYKRINHL
jgi:hypothetical protein